MKNKKGIPNIKMWGRHETGKIINIPLVACGTTKAILLQKKKKYRAGLNRKSFSCPSMQTALLNRFQIKKYD